jgi:LysM domain/NlpC/P60 family
MAIQNAVNLIKTACTQWSLGYDQSNRLDFRNGGETDCSALVILTCEQTGLLHGNNIRKNIGATYTGNMRANFQARGWQVLPDLPVSQLHPGDVLLNDHLDVHHQHTAMYVGNGKIAMASIDEHRHASGGKSGDQTGGETRVCSYYNKPWSCVLRFHGTATPGGHTREYIVKAGDSLSLIASKLLGDGNKWHAIYNANKGTIGPDPAKIQPGMKLVIP